MQKLPVVLLLSLLAAASGCKEAPPPVDTSVDNTTGAVDPADIDPDRFILADDLLSRIDSDIEHFVFDVRAEASYVHSHITGALSLPYGQFDQQDLAGFKKLSLDSTVVTYCGCPRHLAGLVADQLIEWGYSNVRVLYEGYWHWRDNGYPIVGRQAQALTALHFKGEIQPDGRYAANTDVFIRNPRNGQLEATLTDHRGRFSTDFRVYGYRAEDEFELRIGSLDAPVSQRVTVGPDGVGVVSVN